MAHKKAGGSTSLGRDSQAKRLGVKMTEGQLARPGSILVRQRGTKIHPGKNVRRGGDDTLYSVTNGVVKFSTRKKIKFDGNLRMTKIVNVVPKEA
jgi:large subunit ribosomal protein L27